ncbi:rano class II histocompatibility antigen, A beta chain-like [Lampris incognitus]|uniref:rano class II histocompatibility antigen, A beta chain-like n=1 Tax=Lampris incognitus TaxID=2546036 RepID=UPI0024B62626|nr:rano class II histocompatibility antigen, A beta chain-like [Lampris incognitus]
MSALRLSSVLLLLLPSLSGEDGLFAYGVIRCQFNSRDARDVVYLEQLYFNRIFQGQYNSTLGNFTGNTEKAKQLAETFNKSPTLMAQEKRNIHRNCIDYIPALYHNILDNIAEPDVKLRSAEPFSSQYPAMLVCSAYNFYPKQIIVTWLKNGKEVTSGVTTTQELPNGNWFYQIHSHLEYTPSHGEKITCMVEHASLSRPKLYDWDPMPESERNKIAIGTAALVPGLISVTVGLICYTRRSRAGREPVPTS